jgi:hypothetical protein
MFFLSRQVKLTNPKIESKLLTVSGAFEVKTIFLLSLFFPVFPIRDIFVRIRILLLFFAYLLFEGAFISLFTDKKS